MRLFANTGGYRKLPHRSLPVNLAAGCGNGRQHWVASAAQCTSVGVIKAPDAIAEGGSNAFGCDRRRIASQPTAADWIRRLSPEIYERSVSGNENFIPSLRHSTLQGLSKLVYRQRDRRSLPQQATENSDVETPGAQIII